MKNGLRRIRNLLRRLTPRHSSYAAQIEANSFERVSAILAAPRGTADWLVRHELQYGGLVRNVPRRKVSPFDARSPKELARGGMIGGDRFHHHGYASTYAKYLEPFLTNPPQVIVEIGVLKGSGLAIWCELFPQSRVIGLDIDLSHFRENTPALVDRGAFTRNKPLVGEFDQLNPQTTELLKLLAGRTADLVVDDGLHSDEAIANTFNAIRPYLSPTFVYIVEDSVSAAGVMRALAPDCAVASYNELTVITR